MANKRYQPTEEDFAAVRKLAGYGLTAEQICAILVNPNTGKPIGRETFFKNFGEIFHTGQMEAAAKVAKTAYQLAVSGQVPAMTMFWLKTRLNWQERATVEHAHSIDWEGARKSLAEKIEREKKAQDA